MNKKLCLFFAIVLALLTFGAMAFAAEDTGELTFNESYNFAFYKGNTYIYATEADGWVIDSSTLDYIDSVTLFDDLYEDVKAIYAYGNDEVIVVTLSFNAGGRVTILYINNNDVINSVGNGIFETYTLIPNGRTYVESSYIEVPREKLFGKKITISGKELVQYSSTSVSGHAFGEIITEYDMGKLIFHEDGRVLFLNYYDCVVGAGYLNTETEIFLREEVIVYEITDEEILEQVGSGKQQTTQPVEESEDVIVIILIAMLALVFVVIPLVAAILSAVFSFKAKKPVYKKLFRTISALLWASLVVMVIAVVIIIAVIGLEALGF